MDLKDKGNGLAEQLPPLTAHAAAVEAARIHAPGLMHDGGHGWHHRRHQRGRWVRHHDRIILFGV